MPAAPSIGAGVLAVAADAHLGAATGPLEFAGGTLRFDASFDPAASRALSLAAPGGTIDTNGNNATLAQAIAGTGALTKSGAGTLTLTGANSYTGGTTIAAGTLQVGNGAHHRQPRRHHRQQRQPHIQPLRRGDLRRRDQRHRHAHQARRAERSP